MDLRLVTAPTAEPVPLYAAKEHLRLGSDAPDDRLVADMVRAAREVVEAHTGRALMPQTWQARLPSFPALGGPIRLPRAPMVAVTELRIVTPDGTEAVVAADQYQVAAPSGPLAAPGQVLPAAGLSWPETQQGALAAVQVTYTAGYANASDVPAPLKSAMMLVLTELYEQRSASDVRAPVDVPAVRRLMDPFRVWWL